MSKKRLFKLFSITAILATVVLLIPGASIGAAAVSYSAVDAGPRIREMEGGAAMIDAATGNRNGAPVKVPAANISTTVGAQGTFLILNDYLGKYQLTTFTLRAQSAKTQIWVQNSLAWPTGDTRSTPVVTDTQLGYLLGQFDSNILPKETTYFGTADAHTGTEAVLPGLIGAAADSYVDPTARNLVLVSNVRDDNYYNRNYPTYIAGFYSPTFEAYFDRNIINIDAYDWANRMGGSSARPYLYEGVFAHEWQHLLHDDYDSDEETFVNEGLSEFAEIVAGYTKSLQGHIDAAAAHPENSLPVWEDQGDLEILADYGWAALFQIYLNEQFGTAFTKALFHNQENGIGGIIDTLNSLGMNDDIEEIYHNFSVAALINSAKTSPKYAIKTFPRFRVNIGTMLKPNPEAFSQEGAPPLGTDYIWAKAKPKDLIKFIFNGEPVSIFPSGWESVDGMLWGGDANLADNWAIFSAPGSATITFDTMFDIEEFWDFGFVQYSNDGGHTWHSLSSTLTTSEYDVNAHPDIIANLPGLTGLQDNWVNLSYKLPSSSKPLLVAFRYMTDWSTTGEGWFIDNVKINNVLYSNGSSTAPFMDITQLFPINNEYTVTFVGIKGTLGSGLAQYKVVEFEGVHLTDAGRNEFDKMLMWADSMVMLVSYDAGPGVDFYADYDYQLLFGHPFYKAPAPTTTTFTGS